MAKSVEKVYGQALFDAAVEKSKMDDLYDGAISLKDVLVKEKDLLTMLNNPRITEEEKNDIIDKVFADKLDDELIGLIKLMVKNNRQKNMIGVLDFFISKVKELKKIGIVKVISAEELSKENKDEIEQKILSTTEYVSLEVKYVVDKDILGGLIIRLGDRVVDSSLKTKLEKISRELSKIMLEMQ